MFVLYYNTYVENFQKLYLCSILLEEFNVLLSEFYNTNEMDRIKEFIYENCIDGIVM